MNIAGSGVIPAGDYNEAISISGSGKIAGNVRCTALTMSGSADSAGDVVCDGMVRALGSAHLKGALKAAELRASGSLRLEGDCDVLREVRTAGTAHFGGRVKCTRFAGAGSVHLEKGAEAEEIHAEGHIRSNDLLNAERIELRLHDAFSRVASIGGSEICVKCTKTPSLLMILFRGRKAGTLEVAESIEGEKIRLENTTAPLVVGDTVTIGKGCTIGLVQYKTALDIHPEARVEKSEKLN